MEGSPPLSHEPILEQKTMNAWQLAPILIAVALLLYAWFTK